MAKLKILKLLIGSFLLVSCSGGGASLTQPGVPLPRVKTAPDFIMRNLNGSPLRLSDFQGKVVILNFWASWCRPCIAELYSLQNLTAQIPAEDLAVLAVGIDSEVPQLRAVTSNATFTFPLGYDLESRIKDLYSIRAVPSTLVIDRTGQIVLFPDLMINYGSGIMTGPRGWDHPEFVTKLRRIIAE